MKKIYKIGSVVALVLGICSFVFMFCILSLPDERIDEIWFGALIVFFLILIIAAGIAKFAEKEYYNDSECWQADKIRIPKMSGRSFDEFFKQQLIKNGFSEFSEYNDNPKNEGVQVFYLKERKKILCVALVASEVYTEKPRDNVFFKIPDELQKHNIARKSVFFMSGTFLPVIYCGKKNKSLKSLLKQAYFQYSGFNVFPCVAFLDEGLIHVTTLMVNYYKGQRIQSKNKKAPSIIYSILND